MSQKLIALIALALLPLSSLAAVVPPPALDVSAFLDGFYDDVDAAKTISSLHQAWSTNALEPVYWLDYLTKLSEIGHCTHQRANRLIQQDDLASSLIAFCVNLSN
jgi:hypothetical protein